MKSQTLLLPVITIKGWVMVPEGWSKQTVGNLFDIQLGKMLNKAAKEKNPQVSYLTNFNVRWGEFDIGKLNSMFFSDKDKDKFSLKAGDLLVCEGGEVGRCAIWEEEITPCYYQKALHRLRPKRNIIPKYFQLYMEHIAGTKKLENFTSRTSIAHLTKEKLTELPVPVPPLPEQTKIAQILSIWDKAISTTEQLLNNSRQQKKALMQQLLTDKKRFPGFEGKWKDVKLDQLATVIMGSSPKSESYNEDEKGLPLLQGNADIKNRKSVPRVFTSAITKECLPGDILLSVRAPVGQIATSEHNACIGRGFSAIRANNGTSQAYLYQWLLWFEARWVRLSQGSTFDSINRDDIKGLAVNLPATLLEQQKIASVLSDADCEIEVLLQELDNLKQEKKALMQQLLTGKRRVKFDE
ncbi:MAG: restriction endonuclease subunit S [Thermodesulfobacteriota bacterium]|nr:restriction endonuclease subunit S [Thermodesulfobacteriota bacterium]